MRFVLSLLAGLLMIAQLAACNKQPLYVDGGWVRLSPNPNAPSAAYFTIHGGSESVTLRGVTVDAAVRAEVHDSRTVNGMMTMTRIEQLSIPAHGEVKFAPGGKHVMLWGINAATVAKGKLPLVLLFSNGDRIIVDAVIQKAGAAPPTHKTQG